MFTYLNGLRLKSRPEKGYPSSGQLHQYDFRRPTVLVNRAK